MNRERPCLELLYMTSILKLLLSTLAHDFLFFNRIKAEFRKSQVDVNFSSSLTENATPCVRRRGKNTFNIAVYDTNIQE